MGADIFAANYQQEPINIRGRLYTEFRTYTELPRIKQIRSYADTADTGADYLCIWVYGVSYENEAYILDVLYTDKAMEYTEPATADLYYRNGVNVAKIESNNGGRGFARNVERILRESYKTNKTVIQQNQEWLKLIVDTDMDYEYIYNAFHKNDFRTSRYL